MQKIDFEEFKELNGNPMSGISYPKTEYYKSDDGSELGTISSTENDRYYVNVLRSSNGGRKGVDNTKSFNERKDWKDAEEWLSNKI